MQKFSIARKRHFPNVMGEDLGEYQDQIVYLRIEPNGNLFWSIHKEQASQFIHADAEIELVYQELKSHNTLNLYLVEATRTDA